MAAQRVVGGVRRGVVLLAFVAVVTAGCGSESPPPGSDEDVGGGEAAGGGDQAAGGGTALAGTMMGFITRAAQDMITFDEIEVLSGEDAAAARAADGEPPVEEGVDVPYLRNPTVEAYEIPVAADVRVQVYDCSAECRLVDWSYRDLAGGAPLPDGSPESPFTVTVHNGDVVEITEIYLP